jgi:hypothetical protein
MVQTESGEHLVLGQMIALEGNIFVMPCHFLRDINDRLLQKVFLKSTPLIMKSCVRAEKVVRLTVGVFLEMQRWEVPDRDLLFIKFSRGFESHKRILAFISKTKEIDNSGGFDVRLDTAGVINNTGEMLPFNDRISYMTKNEVISVPTMVGTPSSGVLHKRLLRYRARTRTTRCSRPIRS